MSTKDIENNIILQIERIGSQAGFIAKYGTASFINSNQGLWSAETWLQFLRLVPNDCSMEIATLIFTAYRAGWNDCERESYRSTSKANWAG